MDYPAVVQSQKVGTTYLKSKQLLPFGFAQQRTGGIVPPGMGTITSEGREIKENDV